MDNIIKFNEIQFRYVYDEKKYTGEIIKSDTEGIEKTVWKKKKFFLETAFLLTGNNTLFACLYSKRVTGGEVIALNMNSGLTIWETKIKGLGSVGHSRYENKVNMWMDENKLTISGWESGGKYVETIDPESGTLLSNNII